MSSEEVLLVSAAVAFVVSGGLVPLLVRFAVGRKLLDMPNLRSSHEVPTPRLGGVAVILGTWIGAAVGGLQGSWPLLVAASVVGLVGLADDLSGLHFGLKASVQALAAAVLIFLFPPQLLSEAPPVLRVAVFIVGVFWIVAVTNAFNFMDGIDGITGGVAFVSGVFLFFLVGAGFLPALVGAVFGFLMWNVSPATIFLGDAGSYFVGFALSATALYASQTGGWSALPFFGGVLVFTPYLFDTAFTIGRRLRSGVGGGVFSAHREHIYQRITPTTSGHRRTSNLYYGLAAASGVAGVLVFEGGAFAFGGVALALICCGVMLLLPRLFGKAGENPTLLDSRGEKQ